MKPRFAVLKNPAYERLEVHLQNEDVVEEGGQVRLWRRANIRITAEGVTLRWNQEKCPSRTQAIKGRFRTFRNSDPPSGEASQAVLQSYKHIAFGGQVEFFDMIEIHAYVSVNAQNTTGIESACRLFKLEQRLNVSTVTSLASGLG